MTFTGVISIKKILITGGAGFVGRHFTEYFLNNEDEVHVVDNIAKFTGGIDPKDSWDLFNPRDYRNFHFHKIDCRDWFLANQKTYFDYVLHLAAMVGGREMIENHPISVADDLSIDSFFWQWATKSKPNKIVCFSSSACYPVELQRYNNYQLLKEDMITFENNIKMPDLTYGWSKLTCEYLAKIAHEKYDLKSVVYRPFSGYGFDQDSSYPFPSICKRVLSNKGAKIVNVWGSGDQMRDFIHIDDCVRGVVTTMDKIDNADAINLSTGVLTSFKDFAKKAANIVGYDPKIEGSAKKPEGVFARGGDVTKQLKMGFKFDKAFDQGIIEALDFFEKKI